MRKFLLKHLSNIKGIVPIFVGLYSLAIIGAIYGMIVNHGALLACIVTIFALCAVIFVFLYNDKKG